MNTNIDEDKKKNRLYQSTYVDRHKKAGYELKKLWIDKENVAFLESQKILGFQPTAIINQALKKFKEQSK